MENSIKLAIVGANGKTLDSMDKVKAMKVITTIYNDKVNEKKNPTLLSFNNTRGGISVLVELFATEFQAKNKKV